MDNPQVSAPVSEPVSAPNNAKDVKIPPCVKNERFFELCGLVSFLYGSLCQLDSYEVKGEDLVLYVSTRGVATCSHCGNVCDRYKSNGSSNRTFKELPIPPYNSIEVHLVYRRVMCPHCSGTPSETLPFIAPNKHVSNKLAEWIARSDKSIAHTILGRAFGIDPKTVKTIRERKLLEYRMQELEKIVQGHKDDLEERKQVERILADTP